MKDIHGTSVYIEPFMHVVPDSEVHLFSLQDYFQGLGKGGNYFVDPKTSWLELPDDLTLGNSIPSRKSSSNDLS